MVLDGLRGYLQLANGLTDVTRERARVVAKNLVAQGEAGVGAVVPDTVRAQVGSLTEDLIATSRANRDLLVNLVRVEVERSVARLGLVSVAELEAATGRARRLEERLAGLQAELREATRPGTAAAPRSTTRRSTAKRSTAKKATAKKATAKKATAKKATAKKATATKATATKATATKATAKRSGGTSG
jgi:polyhydroxyalkanoate synthesis regulator phasin